MVTSAEFRQWALTYPEAVEAPHADKTSFRVGKKIFATLNEPENRVCLKLSPTDQDLFCLIDRAMIYPVPNAWGRQGWTLVALARATPEVLRGALAAAYHHVAPARLRPLVPPVEE